MVRDDLVYLAGRKLIKSIVSITFHCLYPFQILNGDRSNRAEGGITWTMIARCLPRSRLRKSVLRVASRCARVDVFKDNAWPRGQREMKKGLGHRRRNVTDRSVTSTRLWRPFFSETRFRATAPFELLVTLAIFI